MSASTDEATLAREALGALETVTPPVALSVLRKVFLELAITSRGQLTGALREAA